MPSNSRLLPYTGKVLNTHRAKFRAKQATQYSPRTDLTRFGVPARSKKNTNRVAERPSSKAAYFGSAGLLRMALKCARVRHKDLSAIGKCSSENKS